MPVQKAKPVKAVIIGSAASLVIILVILCLMTGVLLILPTIPKAALPYLVLAADAIGVLVGGYLSAALAGSKGLILGLLCGICVFLCQLVIGLLTFDASFDLITFIRLGVMAVCGMLGGIKGVNRKEKVRIK